MTHGHHSNRSEKGATTKQIPLSRFMEDYLTQRNIDEALLSKKENNIYDFFKVIEHKSKLICIGEI